LIAGNWKMHGLSASLEELKSLKILLLHEHTNTDVLICPPFTLVGQAVAESDRVFAIGGQDCDSHPSGARTGDISAEMLKDLKAEFVILGHSERRQFHGETNEVVAAKVLAARRARLTAIVCIGETEQERVSGN